MGLLRRLFGPREVRGIAADTIQFALEAAADTHPNEYMGMLWGEPASNFDVAGGGYVITDVLVIPATKSTPTSATVNSNLIPNDNRNLGSIHSHPNGVLRPSDEDLQTFGSGVVHVIMGAPYERGDWRAFDREGNPTELEVLDVELDDPGDFFDFTEADL